MKRFAEYGVARSENIVNEAGRAGVPVDRVARGYTYNTSSNEFPSTRLDMPGNPFVKDVLEANQILEIGCGVGRNLPWIMDNTKAQYHGLDPNPVMLESFWKVTDTKYNDPNRVFLYDDINLLPPGMMFDVVFSVFVFQHLGYRSAPDVMNVTDITQRVMEHTRSGTVWILYEHQNEEPWIDRWIKENGVTPNVWMPRYHGLPEMLDRGDDAHLIIWKQP